MIDGLNTGGTPKPKRKTLDKALDREPTFRTPEEIASTEVENIEIDNTELPKAKPSFASADNNKQKRSPKEWFMDLSRRNKIILIIGIILLIGGSGAAYQMLQKPAPAAAPAEKKEEAKEPVKTIIYSPLTGLAVSKEQSELPVTGIMIENSPDARPQSGLNKAGVVFEAIAEGGITRFLALFQEEQPEYVGPVRSVRPYYVDWLQGFDAGIAHAGGSAEALNKIRAEGVKDLDQFANGGSYQRVSNRYAPHNLYTSLGSMTSLARSKGLNSSKFTGFPRKAEAASAAPTARGVDVKISGALYDIHYDYDAASNSYKRVLAGKPHLDERSKEQISPKVVVALVTAYGIHPDRVHSTYQTIGSGTAYIFQDGVVTEVIWEKTSPKAQITFKDAAGKAIPLNAGQTWITATGLATNVTFRP